jgi:hypothetical protein
MKIQECLTLGAARARASSSTTTTTTATTMPMLYDLHQIPQCDEILPAAKSPEEAKRDLARRYKQVLCRLCNAKTRVKLGDFQVAWHSAADGSEYYGCQFAFDCKNGCGRVLARLDRKLAIDIVALMKAEMAKPQA